ncbi:hypothetical protein G3495_12985 [Shewanella baltica]|uniref:hypothetical protein n=1 Tax=Shewanella baltica TaxID=62322 RepID=UPI00217D9B50|nr:hypothetical protein [Shewanella baltica]MCS6236031.1 hypothetical protein [Shewanella baltica]MCS6271601.1 hypothetical protein [Shewanella baltica]
MSPKLEQLIQQFLSLNPAEQQVLLSMIGKSRGSVSGIEHRSGGFLGESTTINFAPAPGRCSRCGK